jgi:peptidoglycan/xylan/chitin deacetylase (PgdA/CDA1 family)
MDEFPPRDFVGYGRDRPRADWPGAARLAVSFVLNYEEGGERSVEDGDAHAEIYLTPDIVGVPPLPRRNRSVEDLFEYGSRAGFWRILKVFAERRVTFTSWAVGLALQRNPEAGIAMAEGGPTRWRAIPGAGSTMPTCPRKRNARTSVAPSAPLPGSPARRRSAGTRGVSSPRRRRPSTIRIVTTTIPLLDDRRWQAASAHPLCARHE